MARFLKKFPSFLGTLFLVGILASALAYGADQPGNGHGKGKAKAQGRGRHGAPEPAIALVLGTGLATLGIFAALKRRKK